MNNFIVKKITICS